MPYLLFSKRQEKLLLSSAANYRWRFPGEFMSLISISESCWHHNSTMTGDWEHLRQFSRDVVISFKLRRKAKVIIVRLFQQLPWPTQLTKVLHLFLNPYPAKCGNILFQQLWTLRSADSVASWSGSTVSIPLNHSSWRVVFSYKQKYVHELLVNCLLKLALEKKWLPELIVPPWP